MHFYSNTNTEKKEDSLKKFPLFPIQWIERHKEMCYIFSHTIIQEEIICQPK